MRNKIAGPNNGQSHICFPLSPICGTSTPMNVQMPLQCVSQSSKPLSSLNNPSAFLKRHLQVILSLHTTVSNVHTLVYEWFSFSLLHTYCLCLCGCWLRSLHNNAKTHVCVCVYIGTNQDWGPALGQDLDYRYKTCGWTWWWGFPDTLLSPLAHGCVWRNPAERWGGTGYWNYGEWPTRPGHPVCTHTHTWTNTDLMVE